ncbi:MAG TPA: biopolymer transporter ExbD [Gemmatimonadales bacterium]|nr:biopolymer transporter ExbD [Gemmatimonadales bacterium]
MGMSAGSAGTTTVKASPNVIPMIDIMLVLLIIFMIVTPLISAGFKATMPKGAHLDARPEGDDEIILGIDVSGNYFLNGRPITRETLQDQLTSIYSARTVDKILYFKADNQLQFAKIQEAVEIARKAGARVMAAITEPKAAGLFAAEEKKGKS